MILEFKKWIEANLAKQLSDDLGLYYGDYGKSVDEKGRWISDLYHLGDFGDTHNKIWVWWWDGQLLHAAKGGTHGSRFGHDLIGNHFKGRYDDKLQVASVALPHTWPGVDTTNKVVSEKEIMDMFPDQGADVINALYRQFPKLKRIVGIA